MYGVCNWKYVYAYTGFALVWAVRVACSKKWEVTVRCGCVHVGIHVGVGGCNTGAACVATHAKSDVLPRDATPIVTWP